MSEIQATISIELLAGWKRLIMMFFDAAPTRHLHAQLPPPIPRGLPALEFFHRLSGRNDSLDALRSIDIMQHDFTELCLCQVRCIPSPSTKSVARAPPPQPTLWHMPPPTLIQVCGT